MPCFVADPKILDSTPPAEHDAAGVVPVHPEPVSFMLRRVSSHWQWTWTATSRASAKSVAYETTNQSGLTERPFNGKACPLKGTHGIVQRNARSLPTGRRSICSGRLATDANCHQRPTARCEQARQARHARNNLEAFRGTLEWRVCAIPCSVRCRCICDQGASCPFPGTVER